MKMMPEGIRLSATDLANHLACRNLTALDLEAASGRLRPPTWRDPGLDALQQRGLQHERAYLDHLRGLGRIVTELAEEVDAAAAFDRTCAAMRAGADVIVQASLVSAGWLGRADILLRVDAPSNLGGWSYEVVDTKLARETKAGTILQLCLYSNIVEEIQGRPPDRMHVVAPGRGFAPESFRVLDYLSYYRLVRRQLQAAVDAPGAMTYPEPVTHCEICRWWSHCNGRRRQDDHLGFVAGISKLQIRELNEWNVTTLSALAQLPVPLEKRPRRGAPESYVRIREQARVQHEGRSRGTPTFELLARSPDRGLAKLPQPSDGDIFFDIEGDAFVGEHGLEYLFGFVVSVDGRLDYLHRWSFQAGQERAMFEWFVDEILQRWSRHADLHIYHFAPYEPAAIRRLMGRYGTREVEVDSMLRAGLFVDLHAVVKHSLRASIERYSIKELEPFYGFARDAPLPEASVALRLVERALELGGRPDAAVAPLEVVRRYNRDDCLSTLHLRNWLEQLRAGLVAGGEEIPRPAIQRAGASEKVEERQQRINEVKAALVQDVPPDPAARAPEQQAHWLLSELLEWYRRESKAPWWEYFRLRDLTDEELLHEKAALSGLALVDRIGGTERCPVDRYSYPKQDTDIRAGDDLRMTDGSELGHVERIDVVARLVDVKKRGDTKDVHPAAVFAHEVVATTEQADALLRIGRSAALNGIDAPGPHRAARDLLMRRSPRRAVDSALQRDGERAVDAAVRVGLALDGGVLAIQGPPGAGKTFTGARMICALIQAKRKVGITAISHKVIENLIAAVLAEAERQGITVRCVQKVADNPSKDDVRIQKVTTNAKVRKKLAKRHANVGAGTAWLWSREDMSEAVDVLFVDEAGQMSLADALAVSQSAKSLVLLGDPQQLEQPQQGSHPDGAAVSALEHMLGAAKTMPPEMGIFLPETWRLHPAICAFTSEAFYEGRLAAHSGLERQSLIGPTQFAGAGLWFAPVVHEGNQSSSLEEVDRIVEMMKALLRDGVAWVDIEGREHPLRLEDILIVAPYNAHVGSIGERLPGARVGTVDKFQGQEAPVVIYSMATSSTEEAPRGMEFLYSLNRLNVATSRARCVGILVGNPRLFEPECRTPRHIQLANTFCRYLELAKQ